MYLIGYDLGSSSIKAALVDAKSGKAIATAQSPETELSMHAPQTGWAEQDPEIWWEHICKATHQLLDNSKIAAEEVKAIGIAYQMHGLVIVDEDKEVLRPSIIWSDSRAVEIGRQAFEEIGAKKALSHLLNSPGNFTASKLKWVKDNEPDIYAKIHKMMLPGDYIAMRLTGDIRTTASGLSEGILWDFKENGVAKIVLEQYGISENLIPEIVDTFSNQGELSEAGAKATGLVAGIPVTYRAGDQPNNALALNALQPGEVAATGGTSGVVYGVTDQANYDPQSRVNGFLHVNHSAAAPRIGILLCINGAGIQYRWIKENMTNGLSYVEMNELAASVPIGSNGVVILPFGNGAERMLCNDHIGAHIHGLGFNEHGQAHLCRAALEGIAFSFVYGGKILQGMGVDISTMRVGNDNLFRSPIFAQTISNLLNCTIEAVETNGAVGAAKASGVAIGTYKNIGEAMSSVEVLMKYEAESETVEYHKAYENWASVLKQTMLK
ncbi:MAG: FGGY family carbohydrate kinase [Bacteroidota bacterium]